MFQEIFEPLVGLFTPFNVFRYITFRGAYAAITTLLICFLFGGKVIEALRRFKVGQSIRDDGPATHLAKSGTPTMGGILIIGAVLVSMLLWGDIRNHLVWLILISLVAFGTVGFIDDYLKVKRHNSAGLPAWGKLVGQFAVAIGVVVYLYFFGGDEITRLHVPLFRNVVVDMGILWIPFAVLLVVGSSNAVNFSDGLDGLLSGLLIMVFITLAIISYLTGRYDFSEYLGIPFILGTGELTVLCLAIIGALIGFLWFNSHPAEVFMGDVGSLALGGTVAVIALVLRKELLILVIGGVFVLEIMSVIIQVVSYKLRGKRVFRMAPLHHHFELSGWAESKVVIRFWILGGLFAIIALSILTIQ
ncbi:MAG: phospho-N-acetylmuramoyl-pentapeptide-transferase [Treponema sp.]|nr:phospho-N-acetylmuramoyl-pentapeptide-transferase [Treponema sp.]